MRKERLAILQMICCALLWSTSGILIKLVPWPPLAIACVRSVFAAAVLGGYMLYSKTKFVFNKKSLLLGAAVVAIFLTYMPATKLTTAANAIVLQYTAPVYVLLFSAIFHKRRPGRGDLLAVCFTIAGMALFFLDQLGSGSLAGNLLAAVSGVFLGAMFFITPSVSEEERYSGLLVGQAFALFIGLPTMLSGSVSITPNALLLVVLMGLFQLGLPYILYAHAARHCAPLTSSLVSLIEPLLNPVWVFLVIGERPSLFALFGGVVVLCTVTVWGVWGEKKKKEAAENLPHYETNM